MAIVSITDKNGHSLCGLVWEATKLYKTPALHRLLSDKDAVVRCIAAAELQMRGEKETLDFSLLLSKRKKAQDREISAFILGQIKIENFEDEIKSALLCLLGDSRSSVVEASIYSCGHRHIFINFDKYVKIKKNKKLKEAIDFVKNMKRWTENENLA